MSIQSFFSFLQQKIPAKPCPLIAFVGAGGKTSTVHALAQCFAQTGNRVLLATSTKTCIRDRLNQQENLLLSETATSWHETLEQAWHKQKIISVANHIAHEQGKVVGLAKEEITALAQAAVADIILCEADGAARKALKAPAPHEPVIPQDTDFCIGLIGLDILGKPLTEEHVHRAQLFSALTGLAMGEPLSFASLLRLAEHEQGLFKDCQHMPRAVLLNKFDTLALEEKTLVEWNTSLQAQAIPWWYGSLQQNTLHLLHDAK